MKIIRSELACNYEHYAFGYTTYAYRSNTDSRADLLKSGFLPYTGIPNFIDDSYYLARSLRVKTAPFNDSSENRRVLRKFDSIPLKWEFTPISKYTMTEEDHAFCQAYSQERFSKDFSAERIQNITSHDHFTHICHIRNEVDTVAILLLCCEQEAWHYWFAFFSLKKFVDLPLGKWAMTSFLMKAAEENIPHVYLGTCYGEGALYKVRDFNDISYFDGNQWCADKDRLKALCKNEEETEAVDLIKKQPHYYDNIINKH